jgi:hypothetical protein
MPDAGEDPLAHQAHEGRGAVGTFLFQFSDDHAAQSALITGGSL